MRRENMSNTEISAGQTVTGPELPQLGGGRAVKYLPECGRLPTAHTDVLLGGHLPLVLLASLLAVDGIWDTPIRSRTARAPIYQATAVSGLVQEAKMLGVAATLGELLDADFSIHGVE